MFTVVAAAPVVGLVPTAVAVALISALVLSRHAWSIDEALLEEHEQAAARLTAARLALREAPARASALRPEAVGVDPVDPKILAQVIRGRDGQLPYVERAVDASLRTHLSRARTGDGPTLVCVYGPSKAGKSRTMFEAVQAELPDATVVIPLPARQSLQEILGSGLLAGDIARAPGGLVLWLDDLEMYVRVGERGLDPALLRRLKRAVPGLVVAATAGGRGQTTHRHDEPPELREPLEALLATGVTEDLTGALTTPEERRALAAIVPPLLAGEMQRDLGAVAVSGRRLVRILVSKSHPHVDDGRPCPEGAALTWAAITAYRMGISQPLSIQVLRRLFGCYTTTPTDERFQTAVRFATTPLFGDVALLRGDDLALAPYDYIVQHAPLTELDAERCTWQHLLDHSGPEALFELGLAAARRGPVDRAIDAFRRARDQGSAEGTFNLGVLMGQRGERTAAIEAWQKTAASGHPEVGPRALRNLGDTLLEIGDVAGARNAYEQAIASNHPEVAPLAMIHLGNVMMDANDREAATNVYRRAAATGHQQHAPWAAVNLGNVLRDRGMLESARDAYERAIAAGHPDATPAAYFALGILLPMQGDRTGALAAFEKAIASRNVEYAPQAAFNLGNALYALGDLDGAGVAYRRAITYRHADATPLAMVNLGVVLKEQGDVAGARASYERAISTGHPDARARAMRGIAELT